MADTATIANVDYATAYARLGWHVLPVKSGSKKPLNGNGFAHATTDLDQIVAWWEASPDASIGIALQPSGLVAVDVDPRNGGSIESLPEEPATLTAKTGGGGFHFIYRAAAGSVFPGKLGSGVDIKHNGYVLVEPSVHPNGNLYNWVDWEPTGDEPPPIVPAPRWLSGPRCSKKAEGAEGAQKKEVGNSEHLRGFDVRQAVAEIVTAESFHDNLIRLAAHFIQGGMSAKDTEATIRGLFDAVERHDDRWRDRVAGIKGAVASAVRKYAEPVTESVTLLRADQVKIEQTRWAWKDHLALGALHIVAGPPGMAKTTVALALAATKSAGGRWPDGSRATAGTVHIWSGEDDIATTLVPRLAAMGADLSKIRFIDSATETIEGEQRAVAFDPARHMGALTRQIEDDPPSMLIIDPIVSAVSGDSHKNAETRRGLQPPVDLARRHGIVLIGITHFSKGTAGRDPTERVTGSLAFAALARVVFVVAKRKTEDGRTGRVFMKSKCNIAPDDGGFEFDVEQTQVPGHPEVFASRVLWGDAIEGNARDVLAEAESDDRPEEGGAVDEARAFLLDLLADGEVPAKQVRVEATAADIKWASVRRAKEGIGIKPRKSAMAGGWVWQLPESAKVINMPTPKKHEPLQPLRENLSTFDETERL